jgi:glycosyltransferase involved in cell wall biosynthesis
VEILREAMELDCPGLEVANSCYDYLPLLQAQADRSPLARGEKVVFSYQGSSNIHNRCLGEAVEAFGSVQADVVLQMQLVGSQDNVRALEKLIGQTPHPEHFEILGYRPYGEHFAASMSADAALMLYRPDVSLNYRYCAPNKLYEYPMLGLPVLCSNQPHLRRIVEGEGIGLCVAPDDPGAIAEGIQTLLDAKRREAMAGRARDWFLREGRYESWGAKLETWLRLIAEADAGAQSLKKAG